MKEILLDTDIGGDCDDVGALVLLKTFWQSGKIKLSAVTSCTTMEGAEHTVSAVLGYYGRSVPIGVMREPPFMCEGDFNRYARDIKREFVYEPPVEDAVALMRRTLAASKDKITFVAIGPQRNLARLLKSGADEFGPRGVDLVREKVAELVVMGGTFVKTPLVFEDKLQTVEWNILQDIPAAQFVAENWGTPVVYSPFELGYNIQTGRNLPVSSPARRCYEIRSGLTRASWDLCAAYYGAVGCGDIFSLTQRGKVCLDDAGRSYFTLDPDGVHRVLLANAPINEIERTLDKYTK